MKLTVKQLVIGSDALRRLSSHGIKDLTQKNFYNVSKNIRVITPELELYEKIRQDVLQQYATPTGEIPPKNMGEVSHAMIEAQAREVDLPILVCVLTDTVIEKAEITAGDLIALEWMFELPEEAK